MKYKLRIGFTLIELMVIVSIISLVSVLVIAATNQARLKARDTKRVQDLQQINAALNLYFDKHGRFPIEDPSFTVDTSIGTSNTGLPPSPAESSWGINSDLRELITEGFINSLPTDPINSSQFHYRYEPADSGESGPSGYRTCSGNQVPCWYYLAARLESSSPPNCYLSFYNFCPNSPK